MKFYREKFQHNGGTIEWRFFQMKPFVSFGTGLRELFVVFCLCTSIVTEIVKRPQLCFRRIVAGLVIITSSTFFFLYWRGPHLIYFQVVVRSAKMKACFSFLGNYRSLQSLFQGYV